MHHQTVLHRCSHPDDGKESSTVYKARLRFSREYCLLRPLPLKKKPKKLNTRKVAVLRVEISVNKLIESVTLKYLVHTKCLTKQYYIAALVLMMIRNRQQFISSCKVFQGVLSFTTTSS